MEDEYLNISTTDDLESPNKLTNKNAASNSLTGMSDKEMQQHLDHCMKLAAENKINIKNAFGLHLISIMQNLVKAKESTDLTLASLSLQASSKIYASRIEALYKETVQFHGHLQTIVVGGKTAPNAQTDEDGMEGDMNSDDATERRPQKKKLKSYLGSEESVSVSNSQGNNFAMKPHRNFELIKSAFSATRTSKNLLDSLRMECDSCKINCGCSTKCFKLKEPAPKPIQFCLSKQIKGKLAGIENLIIQSTELEDAESAVFPDAVDTWGGPNNDSDIMENNGNELDVMIDRFSILDITADIFTRDISQAITKGNIVDERLLPPQSVLKKVLRATEKKAKLAEKDKKKREKKPREPFFRYEEAVEDSLFVRGKKISLTDSAISEWHLDETTVLNRMDDKFFSEFVNDSDTNEILKDKTYFCHFHVEMDPQYTLKNYFFKRTQLWKQCRRLHSPINFAKIRPSSFGVMRTTKLDSDAFAENEELVQSFRELSLRDSFNDDNCDDGNLGLPSPAKSDELASIVSNRSGFLEDDVQLMMVTPPELVKPLNVRFHQKPLNVDTDKVKTYMWNIISTNLTQSTTDSTLFSEVYTEVQKRYKNEKNENIPQQLSFVVLLILANQKDLYLMNTEVNKDIIIKKDLSESSIETDTDNY